MTPCDDFDTYCRDLLQGRLPSGQAESLRRHADACPRCRAMLEDTAFALRAMQRAWPMVPVPSGMADAIRARLAEHEPEAAVRRFTGSPWRVGGARRTGWVAAAALLLAAGAGWKVWDSSRMVQPGPDRRELDLVTAAEREAGETATPVLKIYWLRADAPRQRTATLPGGVPEEARIPLGAFASLAGASAAAEPVYDAELGCVRVAFSDSSLVGAAEGAVARTAAMTVPREWLGPDWSDGDAVYLFWLRDRLEVWPVERWNALERRVRWG